jgi:signal peptidase II
VTAERSIASGGWHLSVLRIACALLPQGSREEQMSEWRDEIDCAREDGLPAGRRTLSIAFRSVPRLAWRARWTSRGHRSDPKVVDGGLGRRLPKYFRHSWALTAGRADWTRAMVIASLVVLVDLGSKAMVSSSVLLFEQQHPLPHLTIFHLHNPGLSLTFIDGGFYMPASIAVIGGSLMLLSFISGPPQPRLWLVIGLMVGGAVGNLSERLYHGYVTDFLQIGTVPAVFNFADVAIGLAFVLSFLPRIKRSRLTGSRECRNVAADGSLS